MTDERVVMGRFGRPHGIKGLITVISFSQPPERILDYSDWHVCIKQQWQPLTLLHTDVTHKSILVRVEGYVEREDVAKLTNLDIGVLRSQLPGLPENDYYWHQLIGLKVITLDAKVLGYVESLMATGSNDVLIVQGEQRCLIPYLKGDVVHEVRLEQGEIVVDWEP